jgi:hypothetical protein
MTGKGAETVKMSYCHAKFSFGESFPLFMFSDSLRWRPCEKGVDACPVTKRNYIGFWIVLLESGVCAAAESLIDEMSGMSERDVGVGHI